MFYWTCEKYRNGIKYFVKDIDRSGHPIETKNEDEAWRFQDFGAAMFYFNLGYTIMKHYL